MREPQNEVGDDVILSGVEASTQSSAMKNMENNELFDADFGHEDASSISNSDNAHKEVENDHGNVIVTLDDDDSSVNNKDDRKMSASSTPSKQSRTNQNSPAMGSSKRLKSSPGRNLKSMHAVSPSSTKSRRERRNSKNPKIDDTFENNIFAIQQKKLNIDKKRFEQSCKSDSIEIRAKLMREVRKLQDDNFSDKEIIAIFPEAKPMLSEN